MRALIAGTDRSSYLALDSCKITRDINGKATLTCVLLGTGGYRPSLGNEIIIDDGASPATKYFAGNISRIVESKTLAAGGLQRFEVDAWDYNHIPQRRLVTADYSGLDLYTIVMHVVDTFLKDEGISLGGVASPSPIIDERLTFFYESAASVFNRLATVTGYQWFIDFDKVLHFSAFTSNPAPASFTDTSNNWRDMVVERSDENYRNRQHERTSISVASTAGSSASGQQLEPPITAFAGQVIFPTKYVIQKVLEITVDDIPKTFIGIDSFSAQQIPPSGYDFYYKIGGIGVFALDWGPAVGGEVIRVRYTAAWTPSTPPGSPQDPSAQNPGIRVITEDDTTEQAARKAAEGGSGIWEAIEEQRNIASVGALKAIAQGRLRQFGSSAVRISLETDVLGLQPGQKATVNVSAFGINGNYLIERCEYNWIAATPNDILRTRITLTTNEPYGMPISYVEKLVEMARIGIADGSSAINHNSGISGTIIREIPAGAVNGTNTSFKLSYLPNPPTSLFLFLNGVYQRPAIDYSISGADITYTVAPDSGSTHIAVYWSSGVPSGSTTKARRFNGGSDIVQYGKHDHLRIIGDLGIGFWIKCSSLTDAGHAILAYGKDGTYNINDAVPYCVRVENRTGGVNLLVGHDSGPPITNHGAVFNTGLPDDSWRFVAFSRDSIAKEYKCWVGSEGTNGTTLQFIGTVSYSENPGATVGTGSETELYMGNKKARAHWRPLQGTLAQVYIWSRQITETDIVSAMLNQPPVDGLQFALLNPGNSPEVDSIYGVTGTVTGTTVVAGR